MYPDRGRQLHSFSDAKTPEYEQWHKETWAPILITPTIEHQGIDEGAPLLRFMQLPKLLDVIVNRQLLLPPNSKLKKGDPYECTARPDYSGIPRKGLEEELIRLEDFVPKTETGGNTFPLDYLLGPRVAQMKYADRVRAMSDEELPEALWFAEHERLKHDVACSCWYGSGVESDAMWRLYCGHVGVSITTSISRIKKAVQCYVPKALVECFKLSFAKVTYSNDKFCGQTRPRLVKRLAFRHEEELRLFLDYPLVRAAGFPLVVDPCVLIEKITVTPYAQKWEFETVKATVDRILSPSARRRVAVGYDHPPVEQSTHMSATDPKWPRSSALDYFGEPTNQS